MFTLPPLSYSYTALEPYLDEETMKLHHDKHHATYVEKLNEALTPFPDLQNKSVEDLLLDIDSIPTDIKQKVINHGGGHANHTLFWDIMNPGKKGADATNIKKAVDETFGSLDTFKEKFTSSALGRFGSGWVWLVKSGLELAIIDTPNQDSPLLQKMTPVLGLDVWEHAYYLKYQNRRAEYITAWWNVVAWGAVEERFTNTT